MNEKDPDHSEARYRDIDKTYEGSRIPVRWESRLCIHVGECFRHLPGVFDPRRRPWIKPDDATPDAVAEAVMHCPTGALHFERTDGGPQEPVADHVTVRVMPNGPTYLRGPVRIEGRDRSIVREQARVALCRCGASENKPFCDGSHRLVGFRA